MRLSREIALFTLGGVFGLLIDASIVQLLVVVVGWNPYISRVFSFLAAATFTWWWNRRFTFSSRDSGRSASAEWLHWLGLMGIGALLNYAVYVALLLKFPPLHQWPALAAAVGSLVAALVNFSTARGVLFRKPETRV